MIAFRMFRREIVAMRWTRWTPAAWLFGIERHERDGSFLAWFGPFHLATSRLA